MDFVSTKRFIQSTYCYRTCFSKKKSNATGYVYITYIPLFLPAAWVFPAIWHGTWTSSNVTTAISKKIGRYLNEGHLDFIAVNSQYFLLEYFGSLDKQ